MLLFGLLGAQCLLAQVELDYGENDHCLVEENSLSIGLGLPYSINHSVLGVNTRLYYNVKERLCFGPEFTLLRTTDATIYDLDLVIHYIIKTPWVGFYPLVGVNFTWEKEDDKPITQAPGIVWGAGIHRNINKFTVFTEYSRVESQLRDHFVSAGIFYRIEL